MQKTRKYDMTNNSKSHETYKQHIYKQNILTKINNNHDIEINLVTGKVALVCLNISIYQ